MIIDLLNSVFSGSASGTASVFALAPFDAAGLFAQSAWLSVTVGRCAFALLFLMVVIWLLLIPARRIGQAAGVPPWWRNVRFWAIFVAAVQMLVYALWG